MKLIGKRDEPCLWMFRCRMWNKNYNRDLSFAVSCVKGMTSPISSWFECILDIRKRENTDLVINIDTVKLVSLYPRRHCICRCWPDLRLSWWVHRWTQRQQRSTLWLRRRIEISPKSAACLTRSSIHKPIYHWHSKLEFFCGTRWQNITLSRRLLAEGKTRHYLLFKTLD